MTEADAAFDDLSREFAAIFATAAGACGRLGQQRFDAGTGLAQHEMVWALASASCANFVDIVARCRPQGGTLRDACMVLVDEFIALNAAALNATGDGRKETP